MAKVCIVVHQDPTIAASWVNAIQNTDEYDEVLVLTLEGLRNFNLGARIFEGIPGDIVLVTTKEYEPNIKTLLRIWEPELPHIIREQDIVEITSCAIGYNVPPEIPRLLARNQRRLAERQA